MFKQFVRGAWDITVHFVLFFAELLSKILIWVGDRSKAELFVIFIGVVWVIGSVSKQNSPSKIREYTADEKKIIEENRKDEMRFAFDVLKVRSIKQSMKNPNSFELVDAIKMDDGALCVTYRGTNSFNAITTERVVILSSAQVGAWNESCAGKSGQNLTRIKYAI